MSGINFVNHIANYIGETVTIFTTSGGESGMGFTGVVLSVNSTYIRLITQIGTAPVCVLGNCCSDLPRKNTGVVDSVKGNRDINKKGVVQGRVSCSTRATGSVTDIPVEKIVAFIHNAV